MSPLAGLDPCDRLDALALAEAIESACATLEGLPAKLFVAVDGGGSMPLDAIGADLHLVAGEVADVVFGMFPGEIGAAPLSDTPEAVRAILAGFAEMRRTGRTEARRLRDLEPRLVQELTASVALEPVAADSNDGGGTLGKLRGVAAVAGTVGSLMAGASLPRRGVRRGLPCPSGTNRPAPWGTKGRSASINACMVG